MSGSSEWAPRRACAHYCNEQGKEPERLTKAEFDVLCEADSFADGPHVETFGDRPPEPYNPFRQAWGTLKDGRLVFAELHKSRQP